MKKTHRVKLLTLLALTIGLASGVSAQTASGEVLAQISPRAKTMQGEARDLRDSSRKSTTTTTSSPSATTPASTGKTTTGSSVDSSSTSPTASGAHRAAAEGKTEDLKADIAEHPNAVAKKDADGFTPLHHAAIGGHIDTLDLLLASGADVNAQGERGETALYMAAGEGNAKVVEALLKGGADANLATTELRTPLQKAAMDGHLATVQALLKAGADASLKDKQGRTALDLAERYRVGEDANRVVSALLNAR